MLVVRLPGVLCARAAPCFASPRLRPTRHSSCSSRSLRTLTLASAQGRNLKIIHFNDVYDISPRTIEPVGGASRFAHLVKQHAADNPLVLFSGDCLNPSLLSAFTRGEQMVPVLNSIGVHAACCGNHDLDFTVEVLKQRMNEWKFPWLLSNVLDTKTKEPLAGAQRSLILDWQGLKIGLLGLVEYEWLLTIPSIDCNKDIIYLDFVEEGRRLAQELHASGVDLVIAMTHMRGPNDEILAAEVPEIQIVLGGHDHDYVVTQSIPHGTMIIKSGTDFREFSVINLELETPSSSISKESTTTTSTTGSNNGSSSSSSSSSNSSSTTSTKATAELKQQRESDAYSHGVSLRPHVTWQRIEVTSDVPEDPELAVVVEKYQKLMGTRMDEPLGRSFIDIDTKFDHVRSQETNAGNLMGDIMRLGLDADAAFLNGGTIRSDQIHAAGRLCMRDYVSMLPFTDELVVLRLRGSDVLETLETGVSSWPKREGRFLQVSGITFSFDPRKPAGSRLVPGSVTVAGEPLDLNKNYRVATKAYLRSGKDGFSKLPEAAVEVDGETCPRLATLVHHLLSRIEELNDANAANSDISDAEDTTDGGNNGNGNNNGNNSSNSGVVERKRHEPERNLRPVGDSPLSLAPCAHGLDGLYYYDDVTGQFGIAPIVEGRIINVAPEIEKSDAEKSTAKAGSSSSSI
jgi:5'-nucleotidase